MVSRETQGLWFTSGMPKQDTGRRAASPKAERAYAHAFAEGLPDEYLACRNLGHSWRPHRAEWRTDERAYYVSYLCQRCTTEKIQWVDRRGSIVSSHYQYAVDYQNKNHGRLTGEGRAELRLEQVGRLVAQFGPPQPQKRRPKDG